MRTKLPPLLALCGMVAACNGDRSGPSGPGQPQTIIPQEQEDLFTLVTVPALTNDQAAQLAKSAIGRRRRVCRWFV